MSTLTEYTFNELTDFPNAKVNLSDLQEEIRRTNIVTALSHISKLGDICSIFFHAELSSVDELILNNTVSIHQGKDTINEITKVKIQEESVPTGGNFASESVNITSAANSSSQLTIFWPYPISALQVKISVSATQKNDTVDLIVGNNTPIGLITEAVDSTVTAWNSQNYIAGDKVTFTSALGSRVYTCINNTTSNQNPLNESYWKHGFAIKVDDTVMSYTESGYYLKISNGVTTNVLGRVIDKLSNHVYIETAPVNNFSLGSYILQSVYIFKNFNLGSADFHAIGDSKIGGSYIPKNTVVTVIYYNNHSESQTIKGSLEYLY